MHRLSAGYDLQNTKCTQRLALLRLNDGRLLSGCGGDLEVMHPLEIERSQHTGMPVRVTAIQVFRGLDNIINMQQINNCEHILVSGSRHVTLLHSSELYEGTELSEDRFLTLNSRILHVNAEKHVKNELLLTFLLDSGISHYSLNFDQQFHYECLLCFKCTRPIESGILWRDGGALHVAYYDGFIRVGIINEDYEDMLLVKKISADRNNVSLLYEYITEEVDRLLSFEKTEGEKRTKMLERMKKLQTMLPASQTGGNGASHTDDELILAYHEFTDLKMTFKNHSIRADRISHRLLSLRKLLTLISTANDCVGEITKYITALEKELVEMHDVSRLYDECSKSQNRALHEKSKGVMDEKKYEIEELLKNMKTFDVSSFMEDWDVKMTSIIESLNGSSESPKDMRNILCHNIFEHRPDRMDQFSHFLLDTNAREMTLYCMSGLSTMAVYPRKALRVASISLDESYSTVLTGACLMQNMEGVYVADSKGIFPVYFNREKRYFDAGNPIALPPIFDHITSILMESDGLLVGSMTGGLLHLAFDMNRKFEHITIASSMMAHPFSNGPILDLKMLAAGDSYLSVHCSADEVVISEKDYDRWHRVTYHTGGAHSICSTPFSLEHRGAFLLTANVHYARIKALQYTEDNLVVLHDLGDSRVFDENGKPVNVLHISLDPSMEYRPIPCKLRYAVGYADKAIRTYVALLTGDHEFNVTEKFIAQIEPLHNISQMICFNGRPMGCYASHSKTLQIWNDLDRHQQKKMKSERMEIIKKECGISLMDRIEGRTSYLLIAYKDNRIEVFEEKGKGTGKIELAGQIQTQEPFSVMKTRHRLSSCGDRLIIHLLSSSYIHIYTVLIENGKLTQSDFVLSSRHSIYNAKSFEFLQHKPSEFIIFGNGIDVHRLTENECKNLNKYRDFEF